MMKDHIARSRSQTPEIPEEVGTLLEEIECEPIPERLLALATELQSALARHRVARSSKITNDIQEEAVE